MKKSKVLVIGSGGREHAIVWKFKQSKLVDKIYCIPGSDAIGQIAECHLLNPAEFAPLIQFVREKEVDLTFVGPETPLVAGIVDAFRTEKFNIIGPDKNAAQLEGSKTFAKQFMKRYDIPTAEFETFTNPEFAVDYLNSSTGKNMASNGLVVKADGLAAGKGVLVCDTIDQAKSAIDEIMRKTAFGAAGKQVVIEQRLNGVELTVLAFCDRNTLYPLAPSQDHKRVYDNDRGPNTGGMGAYAPAPLATPQLMKKIERNIFANFLRGVQTERMDFRGVIYFGLMIVGTDSYLLEFNCRLGDPETQVVLPVLEQDIFCLSETVINCKLNELNIPNQNSRTAACVVLASGGYPATYEVGKEIYGLDSIAKIPNIIVFHSGTKLNPNTREYITNGGRVLAVTGIGQDLQSCLTLTYKAVEKISFTGMHYRKDIGHRAILTR